MKFLAPSFVSTLLVLLSVSGSNAVPNVGRSTDTASESLTDWTKAGLNAIFQYKNAADYNAAIAAFFSPNVNITLNGSPVPFAGFVAEVQSELVNSTSTTLTFSNTIEAPGDPKNPTKAGSVGVFVKTAITLKSTSRGKHIVEENTAAMNIVIAQEPATTKPAHRGGPAPDNRKVIAVNRVSTNLTPVN